MTPRDWLASLVGDWTNEGRPVPDDPVRHRTGRIKGRVGTWRDFTVTDYRPKGAAE